MSILIEELRIRNYKCYEHVDVKFKESNLILGANNVGKTSLLEALDLCFTQYARISEELIFIKKDEQLVRDKEIILDVLITSVGESFEDKWFQLFGNFVMEEQFENRDAVALRTVIRYNRPKGEYELRRKAMNVWPKSSEVANFANFNTNSVTREIIGAIPVFYLDAKRDIVSEMSDKYSYWGRLVRDISLSDDELEDMERSLNAINESIIKKSPVLNHLSESLNQITKVMGSGRNAIEINPVTRRIKDLNRGMEIRYTDKDSESFSISNHGMGTRSWTTFLTLSAYIDWKSNEMEKSETPFHPLLLLEEPESHLHPQAQRRIFHQMKSLEGQKIISSHSPIIAAQSSLDEIIHVYKKEGSSSLNYINLSDTNEIRKIREEVLKTRGDILFADTLILCEGETEEQVLPEFFKAYFGAEPFELGTTIVGVGGSGKYKPFMRVAKDLGIDLFILSDGEDRTVKEVEKHYEAVFSKTHPDQIIFLPNKSNFEEYLVFEGYTKELIKIVDSIKKTEDFLTGYIRKNQGQTGARKQTKDKCPECKQFIFKGEVKDYSGDDGFEKALLEQLDNIKTEYSAQVGKVILERNGVDRIPSAIRDLFVKITDVKGYKVNFQFSKGVESDETNTEAEGNS